MSGYGFDFPYFAQIVYGENENARQPSCIPKKFLPKVLQRAYLCLCLSQWLKDTRTTIVVRISLSNL